MTASADEGEENFIWVKRGVGVRWLGWIDQRHRKKFCGVERITDYGLRTTDYRPVGANSAIVRRFNHRVTEPQRKYVSEGAIQAMQVSLRARFAIA